MESSRGSRDPLEIVKLIEEKVTSRSLTGSSLRKYFGFSRGSWYGGSFAGYVIGCNLNCVFCWAWFRNRYELGYYLAPGDVAKRLTRGAIKTSARVVRVSGGEPTIGFNHLLEVLREFSKREEKPQLVLETNGILLGYSRACAGELGEYSEKNISIRVSLKGVDPDTFGRLTGVPREYFSYQLNSIENLIRAGFNPGKNLVIAVMSSFNKPREIAELMYRLSKIDEKIVKTVELEVVKMYRNVKRKLESAGLHPYTYINPDFRTRRSRSL